MNRFESVCQYTRRAILPLSILAVCLFSPSVRAQGQKAPATPDLIRNVDEPGFNSYQSWKALIINHGVAADDSFTIPPNKVLVLEHISVSGDSDTVQPVTVQLNCQNGSSFALHFLVMSPQFTIAVQGATHYVASQPLKCYASGQGLSVHIIAGAINTVRRWDVSVSGYLVPE
jgi:hypothetical protein